LCAPLEVVTGLRDKEHGCRTLTKNNIRNLKQLMRMIPMEVTTLNRRRNREFRKTSAVGHNSREALLTNYFP